MTGGSETSSVLKRYAMDPARHLEAVFRDIERTRMAGLPILNTALAVEAVGFTQWQGNWLGALITPWFLNLVLVPGAQGDWPHAAEGERIVRQLPAGDCNFYGCFEPAIGEFHASSLWSPMSRFADHAAARAEALYRLDAWLAEPPPAEPAASATDEERRAFLRRMIPAGDR
jgi:[NiFe] hydrogenase assembly HybE family chaperone